MQGIHIKGWLITCSTIKLDEIWRYM